MFIIPAIKIWAQGINVA